MKNVFEQETYIMLWNRKCFYNNLTVSLKFENEEKTFV